MNVYAPKQHARIHIFLFLGRGVRGIILFSRGKEGFRGLFSEILQCDFINLNFEKKRGGGSLPSSSRFALEYLQFVGPFRQAEIKRMD